jgi:hypothetical protein
MPGAVVVRAPGHVPCRFGSPSSGLQAIDFKAGMVELWAFDVAVAEFRVQAAELAEQLARNLDATCTRVTEM